MALRGLAHYLEVPILDRVRLSSDSFLFRFGLGEGVKLGLPVGQHLVFRAEVDGEELLRKYTPTSKADQLGYFEIPIKVYRKTEKFPAGGKFTQIIERLDVGDLVQVAGPRGNIRYLGGGSFDVAGTHQESRSLGFVAGGTGITPCFQVIQHVIDNEDQGVDLTLVYANKTEDDILLKAQLDAYARSGRLKLHYVLENPPLDWSPHIGLVSQEILKNTLHRDSIVFHCGPRPMNLSVKAHLTALGFERVNKF